MHGIATIIFDNKFTLISLICVLPLPSDIDTSNALQTCDISQSNGRYDQTTITIQSLFWAIIRELPHQIAV